MGIVRQTDKSSNGTPIFQTKEASTPARTGRERESGFGNEATGRKTLFPSHPLAAQLVTQWPLGIGSRMLQPKHRG